MVLFYQLNGHLLVKYLSVSCFSLTLLSLCRPFRTKVPRLSVCIFPSQPFCRYYLREDLVEWSDNAALKRTLDEEEEEKIRLLDNYNN